MHPICGTCFWLVFSLVVLCVVQNGTVATWCMLFLAHVFERVLFGSSDASCRMIQQRPDASNFWHMFLASFFFGRSLRRAEWYRSDLMHPIVGACFWLVFLFGRPLRRAEWYNSDLVHAICRTCF